MKSIIKILLIMLIVVLLNQCKKDSSYDVEIPDNNFLNTLIKLGVDANINGSINSAEAEGIKSINLDGKNISDMTGIEAFVNLDTLSCHNNQLASLDLSNNSALTFLDCSINQLISLDVFHCTALEIMWCSENQLTNLDLSSNAVLIWLACDENQLTNLNLSNNIALQFLSLAFNQINSLDISINTTAFFTSGLCLDNAIPSVRSLY